MRYNTYCVEITSDGYYYGVSQLGSSQRPNKEVNMFPLPLISCLLALVVIAFYSKIHIVSLKNFAFPGSHYIASELRSIRNFNSYTIKVLL